MTQNCNTRKVLVFLLALLCLSSCGKFFPARSVDREYHPGFQVPKPNEVTNPRAVSNSTATIDLTWGNGGGTTAGFQISYRAGGIPPVSCSEGDVIPVSSLGLSTHFQITGLTPGTTYGIRVCSINSSITPDLSDGVPLAGVTTNPVAPQAFTATAVSGTRINLSWSDGAGETSYVVESSLDQTSWSQVTSLSSDATSYQNTGLTGLTTYYYRIRAMNADGASSYSTANATTLQPAPNNPGGPSGTVDSTSQITLDWTSGGGTTAAFQISYQTGSSAPADCETGTVILSSTVGNVITYPVTGLTSGTQYSFRICAANGNATPDLSSGVTVTGLWTVPDAPGAFTATTVNSGRIDLTWTDVSGETSYTIDRSPNGVNAWVNINNPVAGSTSYSNTSLTAGTAYYYRISATNSGGTSAYSTSNATTTAAPPDPSGVSGTVNSTTQITLDWTSGGGTTSAFQISYQTGVAAPADCSTGTVIPAATVGNVITYPVTGLSPGTTYSFLVCAVDATSQMSAGVAVANKTTTTLSAPASNYIAADAAGGASVNYDNDTSEIVFVWTVGSGAVTYTVTYYTQAGCAGGGTDITGVGPTFRILNTGLASGTTYSFKVKSVDGASNASALSACSNDLLIDTVNPNAPSVPYISADANGGASVSYDNDTSEIYFNWTAGSDATSGVASYTVTYYSQGACAGAGTDVTGITNAYYGLTTGLASGTTYSFKVKTVDNAGNVSGLTACSNDILIDTTNPNAPSAPYISADTNGGASATIDNDTSEIYFNWTAGSDATSGVASYTVTYYTQGSCAGAGTDVTGITNAYYGLTSGLASGTTYSFKVKTIDNAGNASAVTVCSNDILLDTGAPNAPTSPYISADANGGASVNYDNDTSEIYFNWTAGSDAGSGVASYTVTYYSQAACAGGGTDVTGITNTYYGLTTGLASGTSYSFKVKTVDNAGNVSALTACSNNMLIDTVNPVAPTVPYISADTNGGVSVNYDNDTSEIYFNWTAGSDATSGVASYTVTYYTQAACAGAGTDVTGITNAYYGLTAGLANGTTYSFKVKTVDNAGNVSALTACSNNLLIDTTNPNAPSAPYISADASGAATANYDNDISEIYFNWTAGSDASSGVASYTVTYYTQAACAGAGTDVTGVTNAYYALTAGLASGTTYSFKVKTIDNAGNASALTACSNNIILDTVNPVAPTSPYISADANGGASVNYDNDTSEIYFNWTAGSDAASGVASYTVTYYTQAACAGAGTDVTGITNAYYGLTAGLASGSSYSFKVKTVDNAGNVSALTACSNSLLIDTVNPVAPTVPYISADAAGGASANYDNDTSEIYFNWTAGSDATSGVASYTVTYYTQAACAGGGTDVTGITNAYYGLTTGLASGTTYSFKVKTVDNAGNVSALTACSNNILIDTVNPVAPSSPYIAADASNGATTNYDDDTSEIYFIWTAGSDATSGLASYTVTYYSQANCGGAGTDVTGITNAYYGLTTGLATNTTYSFKVKSVDNSGNVSALTACSNNLLIDTTAPSDPSAIFWSADAAGGASANSDDDTGVFANWTASADAQSGIASYTLTYYSQTNCGGVGTDVTGITNAYYNLTGLSDGTTYSFKVKGYNNAGIVSNLTACSGDMTITLSSSAEHTVFVTSTTMLPSGFNGISGADAECVSRATVGGLDTSAYSWKAVISDSSTNAKDRINIVGGVALVGGTAVATNAADVWDGTLLHAINVDETGASLPGPAYRVWTGTDTDGTNVAAGAGVYCDDWNDDGGAYSGVIGDASTSNGNWIQSDAAALCGTASHFYCISQRKHKVFTTSTTYDGNLGGRFGADAKCAARATAAGLPGVWKAVISDGTEDAQVHLNITAFGGIILVGTAASIASSNSDLWDGFIGSNIDHDEFGNASAGSLDVWTGTAVNGAASASHCNDWTTNNVGNNGTYGRRDDSGSSWVNDGNETCDQLNHLYCISQ